MSGIGCWYLPAWPTSASTYIPLGSLVFTLFICYFLGIRKSQSYGQIHRQAPAFMGAHYIIKKRSTIFRVAATTLCKRPFLAHIPFQQTHFPRHAALAARSAKVSDESPILQVDGIAELRMGLRYDFWCRKDVEYGKAM
jgi:hypothetical protein